MTAAVAAVVGLAGPTLSTAERSLFEALPPAGFILFKRNCVDRRQLADLTHSLRDLYPDRWVPILTDQEGGRVQRLAPPHWPALPPLRALGRLDEADAAAGEAATRLHAAAIAALLQEVGIDVVCAPCLDLLRPETTAAIGDRAFAADPDRVARLGRIAALTFMARGVLPVIKHLPGHGRATSDSHLELPRVTAPLAELQALDWRPFEALADLPLAMTAHIVFDAVDPERPATQSKRVIDEVIRGAIGFRGILFSDDLSMQALTGPIEQRATQALAAGCDLALHCNGKLDELESVLRTVGALPAATLERLLALQPKPAPDHLAVEPLLAELMPLIGRQSHQAGNAVA